MKGTGRRGVSRALLALALVAPALAGCLGAAVEPPGPNASSAVALFRYLCPGDAGEGAAEPCLGELPRGDAALQQPFVAIDTQHTDVMAVGVHHTQVGVAGTRLALYLTEDGGATWRETFVPMPAGTDPRSIVVQGDPAMLFDPDGTLHVTALGLFRAAPVGYVVPGENPRTYYVKSHDLGRTWNEPLWLGSEDGVLHDRNWIVRDPASGVLYVMWANHDEENEQIAWSVDGGATWRDQAPGQRASCYRGGMPVVLQGGFLFACSLEGEGVKLYAFDANTGESLLLLDALADGQRPFLTALGDGALVLHYDTCTGTTYPPTPPNPCPLDSVILRSYDGGDTWAPGGSALGLAVEGDWHRARIYWSEADAFGGQHLLVRYERDEPHAAASADPTWRTLVPVVYEERHVVLDGSGAILESTLLETWRSEPARADEWVLDLEDEGWQSGHPRCAGNSCFHGMAWAGDQGLVAFAHDGTVRLSLVTRNGPPLGPMAPIRTYVPTPSAGLDEPVAYEFDGHVNVPGCYAEPDPNVQEALRDRMTFEFEVPADTRMINATLAWDTQGPVSDVDLYLYDAQGNEWRDPDGETDSMERFSFPLNAGDQGPWTATVVNCVNAPTDFTLEVQLS